MDDVDTHLLGGEFDEGVGEGFDGTVHVTLDDDVELLEVADGYTAADLLESHVLLGLDALDTDELLALVGDALGFALVAHHHEFLTCRRGSVESEDRDRSGRTGFGNLLATLVEHGLDLAVEASAEDDVTHMESSVLDQDSGEVTAALVERRLDDCARSELVGICLELEQVGLKEDLLEELVHVESLLGRDLLALVLATPVLDEDVHLGELAADGIRHGTGLVYLVDGEDHRDVGGLCVVDGFYRLGHDCVVSRDDDDGEVGHLGTTGTHGRKCLMTRGIEEGDVTSVLKSYAVCADVLGDAASLTGDDIGLADVVEQRGLTVVDMTHDGDHRRTGDEVLLGVGHFVALDLLGKPGGDKLDLVTELLGHEDEGLGVETLVDGHHQAEAHAGCDDLDDGGVVHQRSEVVDGHELGDFQDLLLSGLSLHLLLGALRGELALLLAVFGSEVVLLALVHAGVCLLDLLLDLLLHLLLLGLGELGLEAVGTALAALAGLRGVLLGAGLLLGILLAAALQLRIGADLADVDLLGTFADALALFAVLLLLELGHVDLAQDLEAYAAGGSRRLLRLFAGRLACGLARGLRRGRGGLFGLIFGDGFCNGGS